MILMPMVEQNFGRIQSKNLNNNVYDEISIETIYWIIDLQKYANIW